MRFRAALVLFVVFGLGGVSMGEFKSPRDTAVGDVVSTWPAHQKSFEDSVIEATGQAAATPFNGRILVRLDDKGVANGVASLGADGKVPAAQLPSGTGLVGCRANHAGGVALSGGSFQPLALTTEDWDTNGFHDNTTNNTRITVPAGYAGYYLVEAWVQIQAATAAGAVMVGISVNLGAPICEALTPIVAFSGPGINMTAVSVSFMRYLNAGDYVQLQVWPEGCSSPVTAPGEIGITRIAV